MRQSATLYKPRIYVFMKKIGCSLSSCGKIFVESAHGRVKSINKPIFLPFYVVDICRTIDIFILGIYWHDS